MRFVLQAHHIEFGLGTVTHIGHMTLVDQRDRTRWQQAFRLQLLAAQADHHHLATEVRVQADIAQRADRNDRVGCVDGHAAAIGVRERHHVVHVRVLGQQLGLDALHGKVGHTGHTLHGLRDGQDVARADRAVQVAVTLEGVALQRLLHGRLDGGDRQSDEFARLGHLQQALVHPGAARQVFQRVADGHVVAAHGPARRDVNQRHLVRLGHLVDQGQAIGKHRASRQAAVVGHDGHVVGLVHGDVERGLGCHRGLFVVFAGIRRVGRSPPFRASRRGPVRSRTGPGRAAWAPACGHSSFRAVR